MRILQEYQRAVIFRLGRVKKGGAVGPGDISSIYDNEYVRTVHVFCLFEVSQFYDTDDDSNSGPS